ncbi:hypothetical protein OF83DRAFT_364966 [Amylostereum chailletii]|nr:hypothetical protein OF83DRAFT_364966 [Amylostereum chailletii]
MDAISITYIIDHAQQFWAELDDILRIPPNATLSSLDYSLKRFVSFCASYHEQFLQSPMQLEHACDLLLVSELFTFHSERMCVILSDEAISDTDPHHQLILYNILLLHGRQNPSFFRSYKRWQPIFPMLMDHVLVDIDPDLDDTYSGHSAGSSSDWKSLAIPIEAKLRSLAVRLLYEALRASKLSIQELRVFDDPFIDRLFDLVEQTRGMQDETFNYSVIKLLVALNEQFMVAALKPGHERATSDDTAAKGGDNRILQVLMRRLNTCQTFGENMIFMLNRAGRSPEDLVMQLLVLKLLYILFTTKSTCEFFYTNDLCVLVDVFLRELNDLDDDSESLRHTYLRVLHPLLTKTQLRQMPYKRPQIVRALESLIEHPEIRDVSPTTKRLVERCLAGDWCVQLRKIHLHPKGKEHLSDEDPSRTASPSNDRVAQQLLSPILPHQKSSATVQRQGSLKGSRSVENLNVRAKARGVDALRKPANDSTSSLPGVAVTTAPTKKHRERGGSGAGPDSMTYRVEVIAAHRANSLGTAIDGLVSPSHAHPVPTNITSKSAPDVTPVVEPMSPSMTSVSSADSRRSSVTATSMSDASSTPTMKKPRRSAPPPPPKRRKPPAVPVPTTNDGVTFTTIASSKSTPTVARARP